MEAVDRTAKVANRSVQVEQQPMQSSKVGENNGKETVVTLRPKADGDLRGQQNLQDGADWRAGKVEHSLTMPNSWKGAQMFQSFARQFKRAKNALSRNSMEFKVNHIH